MSQERAERRGGGGAWGVIVLCVLGVGIAVGIPRIMREPLMMASHITGREVSFGPMLWVCSLIGGLLGVLALVVAWRRGLGRAWLLPGAGVLIAVMAWPLLGFNGGVLAGLREQAELRNKTETFNGSSEDLKHTVIVPTLDTPMPAGKNVIWCSSFQIAWNKMADSVVKGPMEVIGAEEVAERLNNARASKDDIEPADYFALADWVGNGIVERIQKGMKEKFPDEPVPQFGPMSDDWAVAYAYLQAMIKFTHPFGKIERLPFTDSTGNRTGVAGFGCESHDVSGEPSRRQIEILYYASPRNTGAGRYPMKAEFAVDLCKNSRPYQIVLACVEQRDTLGETVSDLRQKVSKYVPRERYSTGEPFSGYNATLETGEALMVPEMFWKVSHRFEELEGRTLAGVGPIEEALQVIHFRMDRFGVVLKSEARFAAAKAIARSFVFDGPFLLYMQKRGANQPFLVMWVDNAELLTCAAAPGDA